MAAGAISLDPPDSAGPGAVKSRSYSRGVSLRIITLLQATLMLMLVANLGRIPALASDSKEAPILFNDLFLLTLLGASSLVAIRNRKLVIDATGIWALAFASIGGISAAFALYKFNLSIFELVFSIAYLLRWLAYFCVYLVVINYVSRDEILRAWKAVEAPLLIFAAFGIFQSAFLPGFAQIVYPNSIAYVDWDIQGRRLVSTFLDPNFAGGYIVMGLLVSVARLSVGETVAKWKLLLLAIALILTISRSSFLAMIVGSLVILAVSGLSRRVLKVGLLGLVLVIPAVPAIIQYATAFNKFSIDASALSRVTSWLQALEIIADNPLIGVGFNTYGFVRGFYGNAAVGMSSFTLDGGLIFITVMTGMIGVALYSGMIGSVLFRCRRIWRSQVSSAPERGLAIGIGASTVALVVHSFFLNSLLYPFLMEPFWVLWGIVAVISRREHSGSPDEPGIRAAELSGTTV